MRIVWGLAGLVVGPLLLLLAAWLPHVLHSSLTSDDRSADTTWMWHAGKLVPGPRLKWARPGPLVARLEDGSILVLTPQYGPESLQRLPKGADRFVRGAPPPFDAGWQLLPFPGGAVLFDSGDHGLRAARYSIATDRWTHVAVESEKSQAAVVALDGRRVAVAAGPNLYEYGEAGFSAPRKLPLADREAIIARIDDRSLLVQIEDKLLVVTPEGWHAPEADYPGLLGHSRDDVQRFSAGRFEPVGDPNTSQVILTGRRVAVAGPDQVELLEDGRSLARAPLDPPQRRAALVHLDGDEFLLVGGLTSGSNSAAIQELVVGLLALVVALVGVFFLIKRVPFAAGPFFLGIAACAVVVGAFYLFVALFVGPPR